MKKAQQEYYPNGIGRVYRSHGEMNGRPPRLVILYKSHPATLIPAVLGLFETLFLLGVLAGRFLW
jgi:hypothetical protein